MFRWNLLPLSSKHLWKCHSKNLHPLFPLPWTRSVLKCAHAGYHRAVSGKRVWALQSDAIRWNPGLSLTCCVILDKSRNLFGACVFSGARWGRYLFSQGHCRTLLRWCVSVWGPCTLGVLSESGRGFLLRTPHTHTWEVQHYWNITSKTVVKRVMNQTLRIQGQSSAVLVSWGRENDGLLSAAFQTKYLAFAVWRGGFSWTWVLFTMIKSALMCLWRWRLQCQNSLFLSLPLPY